MKMPICATAGVASGGAATVAGVRKNASVSVFKPKIPLILPQPILPQPIGPLPGLVIGISLKENFSYRNCPCKTRLHDTAEQGSSCAWIRSESIVPADQSFHPENADDSGAEPDDAWSVIYPECKVARLRRTQCGSS
jgi:hypothetical protein